MHSLGNRLKEARENKRLTQVEVARKLGISNGTLSGYERDYRDPDTDTLKRLADLYEVSVDWLTGRASMIKENSVGYVASSKNELIIKDIVNKYNIDLSVPGAKERLERIIQFVIDDYMKQ